MNIYAINLSCARDNELSELMRETLQKHAEQYMKVIRTVNTDGTRYYNGAGWIASMIKLNHIRQMLKDYDINDEDFILSVDSDVVFCNTKVFEKLNTHYGILGAIHEQPYPSITGPFGHMSGALIFIRGDIAKKMCSIPEGELERIRQDEFKGYNIVENEDVVISYLAMVTCGAIHYGKLGRLSSGNFEEEIQSRQLASYYHLNYLPTEFLGEKVTGKWDIARVLKMKGIKL